MYQPAHFRETRGEVLAALMRAHPLATLVTPAADAAGGFDADHLPMEYDPLPAPFGTLRGHVARANPLWHSAAGAALAIFQGPHAYISPAWYPSKQDAGKAVPTWNYAVVHAHGPLKIREDAEWLRKLVTRLTASQESPLKKPWHVTDAPPDYIDTMLKAIVGIEIPLSRLQGKWKMSQNRLPQDRDGVIQGLEARDDEASLAMLNALRQ